MKSLLQCLSVGQTLSPAQPPGTASSSRSLWKGWALEGNTLVGPSFLVSEKQPSSLEDGEQSLGEGKRTHTNNHNTSKSLNFTQLQLSGCFSDKLWSTRLLGVLCPQNKTSSFLNRRSLTWPRRPASRTGSPYGRSASWLARSAWRRWACRRLCAGAQKPGSGSRAPSRVAAADTASAPWPPEARWRRRSRPPCGTPSECGDSLAARITKPEERKDYFIGIFTDGHVYKRCFCFS